MTLLQIEFGNSNGIAQTEVPGGIYPKMIKDSIPYYTNDPILDEIREHNTQVARVGEGQFRFNGAFIDLNNSVLSCNLQCPGCLNQIDRGNTQEDRLSLDEIRTITDFVKSRDGRVIVHPGFGEPMMDPDFWNVINYTRSSGMSTVLYTNGTMINEETARRLYDGSVYVLVKTNTLDTEKQDRMVGRRGAGARIQNALQHLMATGFKSPRLGIDSLIARDNAEDLRGVLRFCRENDILPYFESFVTTTVRPEDYEGRVLSQQEFDGLFRELQRIDREEFGVETNVRQGMRVYGVNLCIKFNTMFNARYDGRIQLAPHAEPLGNMRETPLDEILNPRDKRIFNYYINGCRCSLTVSKAIEI